MGGKNIKMFITVQEIYMREIIIPRHMTQPNEKNLDRVRASYEKNGTLGSIILDKDFILRDGYLNYLVAKENYIDRVECLVAGFKFNSGTLSEKDLRKMLNANTANKQELTIDMQMENAKILAKMKTEYERNDLGENWSGEITKEIKYSLYVKVGGKCPICGNQMMFLCKVPSKYRFSVDHNIPRCVGGESSSENCVAMCKRCNNIKSDILPDVFKNQFKSAMAEEVLREPEYQNMLLRKILKDKFVRRMDRIRTAIL